MSAPITGTAKRVVQHSATSAKATRTLASNTFLSCRYEPRPRPINSTTYQFTINALHDSTHPLHIKTKRRYADFDPSLLHWTVKVPVALSKNATVRNWAAKRVREAVRTELKARGFGNDGSLLDGQGLGTPLKGALTILISKSQDILLANGTEVKEQASRILEQVIWKCRNSENRRHDGPRNNQDRSRPRYDSETRLKS